jgi:hypothetical protein
MKYHLFCIGAAVVAFCSFAHAADQPKQEPAKKEPAKKIVVPFELIKTQHMVVNVKVNGKGPYRLVFDTGAPDNLISNKVAKEADVFPKNFRKPLFALFGSMGQMKINQIEIGDLKAENVSTMVIDHPTVQAIASYAGPLEGIIGFTFYARYKMSIDYEKKLMTFEPGEYQPPPDVMKVLQAKLEQRLRAPKSGKEVGPVLAPAGLLGIRVTKEATDQEPGVVVKDVMPDTPAAAAGFKAGDRLLTLDGRWTDSVADCYFASGQLRIGTPTTAEVYREGKKLQLKVTLRAGL